MTTEVKVQDKVEVNEFGVVGVREVTRYLDDGGNVVAESKPHRKVIFPGEDVSAETGVALEVCQQVFTPERISAHNALRSLDIHRLRGKSVTMADLLAEQANIQAFDPASLPPEFRGLANEQKAKAVAGIAGAIRAAEKRLS